MAAGVVDGAIIVDTGIKNDKAKVGAKDFIRMVDQMAGEVNKVGQWMSGSVNGYIQAMNRARTAAKALTGDQAAIAKEILSTTSALKKLEERHELVQRKWEAAREEAIAKASDEFTKNNAGQPLLPWENEEQAAQQFAEDMQAVINDVIEKFGAFEDTAAFRNMNAEVEFLTDKLESLKAMLADLQQQESQPAGDTADRAKEAADSTRETAENTRETEAAAKGAGSAFQSVGAIVGRAAGGFVHLAGSAARAGASIVKIAGGGALSFLRKLAEGARNAAIQLAKLSGRAISGGFKTLGQGILAAGKWMLGLKSSTQQANGGFKRGLMTILKYGLGIRSLYFLFRKLRTAVVDSFNELAKHDSRTRNSINSLKTALAGLKGSLATAFSPIFNAVAPALTYLINMLTAAINAIGAFMAALTGQRTYQKAVANISAAGDAASGAGSAASDAADDYKELKRELAGFDDLDILGCKDKSSSSGGSGGGGGGGGSGFSYETEEIASGVTDFVGKLKELWANADYEGIGRIIAEGINSAFTKAKALISWDTLGEKITEAVSAITGIINGLVDNIDWTLIGETFGEGINTLIKTFNLLLTGINWENLGTGFAESLNGLVDTVNWDELGQLFANKLNALISTIKGLVSGFKWGDAGEAFATTVNSLMTTVNWDTLANTATTMINKSLIALRTAVDGFDWAYAGTTFANVADKFLKDVNWDTVANTATTLINKPIIALRNAVDGFDWSYAGTTFAKTVDKFLKDVNWDTVVNTATTLINKPLIALRSAVDGFDWGYAGTNFGKVADKFIKDVNWDTIANTATTMINKSIIALRSAIDGFDWSYAGTKFSTTINSLFSGDTRVDWTALGETAAAAIGGPLTALKNAVSTFSFGDAAQAFAEKVNGFFSNEQLWADAGTIVSDSIKGLFTWGKDFLNGLDIDQIAEDIRLALESVDWAGIAESIWNFLGSALDKLGELIWKIIFGPDTNSAEFVHEGEERFNELLSQLGIDPIEVDIRFGLDLNNPQESEWYNELQQAIQDSLRAGEWTVPLDPSIPPEAVELARQEFVYQWNKAHPEAPIDPTLPDDAGNKVKDLWKKHRPNLDTDVNPDLPSDAGKKVQNIWDKQGNTLEVDGEVDVNSVGYGSGVSKTSMLDLFSDSKKMIASGAYKKKGVKQSAMLNLFSDSKKMIASGASRAKGVVQSAMLNLFSESKKVYASGTKRSNGVHKSGLVDLFSDKKTVSVSGVSRGGYSKSAIVDLFTWAKSITISAVKFASGVLKSITDKIKKAINDGAKNKAEGGAITASGREIDFASGGVIRGGVARYLSKVPHYAGGTTRAHGTVFVAGENGPEIMGHINGRTEILNKSQLADAIYSAVVSGMGQAVNALGTFLAGQMANCTNAITGTIGNLSAIRGLEYHAPVMSAGSVMPYEVSAQIAKTGEDIQDTLNSNNEDLIQTIITVTGQLVAAVQASGRSGTESAGTGGLTVDQVIRQINLRTQMLGRSPLLD